MRSDLPSSPSKGLEDELRGQEPINIDEGITEMDKEMIGNGGDDSPLLARVPSLQSRDSLNQSQNISIMSLRKEIVKGEIKNFVRKSIMANFGESKTNNVDLEFMDVLQGYDKVKNEGNDTIKDSMTMNTPNTTDPKLVRLGSEAIHNKTDIQNSGDLSNFSEKITTKSKKGGGRFTTDYASLGNISPNSRRHNIAKRREMEILIQANHVSDS